MSIRRLIQAMLILIVIISIAEANEFAAISVIVLYLYTLDFSKPKHSPVNGSILYADYRNHAPFDDDRKYEKVEPPKEHKKQQVQTIIPDYETNNKHESANAEVS